jgi:serine/threonine-protein kinase
MGGPASQQVIGRYTIYGKIASGGMASVHFGRLAGGAGFSRTVAIKRLHPHLAEDPRTWRPSRSLRAR